jgi:aryl-alcohol dehydrogenase-like predicted oxidoreductase
MLYAPFGRTGHRSSRIIFGAAALGSMSQSRADLTLSATREAGVNHIDTAASYGDSELRLADFLADHRDDVFLATKTGDRTASEARASLERSLDRMGVDDVDLIQLHNLVEEDEWSSAMDDGGALAAVIQARDEGLCRFIGVTGHGTRIPAMHLRSLERFDFDSVLIPFNHSMMGLDQYRAEVAELRALCRSRNVAVQTIKSIAKGRWPSEPGGDGPRFSWYEPLTDPSAIERAVCYVLSEPDLFLNTTSDARLHHLIYAATTRFAEDAAAPPEAALQDDEARFDITPLFDGRELEVI